MRIEELSVGDWVKYLPNGSPAQVESVRKYRNITLEGKDFVASASLKYLAYIPLTPEILKMNGWRNDMADRNFWATDEVYIYNHDGIWRLRPKSPELLIVVDIKYIHELQHALRLLGVYDNIEYSEE